MDGWKEYIWIGRILHSFSCIKWRRWSNKRPLVHAGRNIWIEWLTEMECIFLIDRTEFPLTVILRSFIHFFPPAAFICCCIYICITCRNWGCELSWERICGFWLLNWLNWTRGFDAAVGFIMYAAIAAYFENLIFEII